MARVQTLLACTTSICDEPFGADFLSCPVLGPPTARSTWSPSDATVAVLPAEHSTVRHAGASGAVGPRRAVEGEPRDIGVCVAESAIERELSGGPIQSQHPHPTLGCRSRLVHDDDARAVGRKPVRTLSFVEGYGGQGTHVIQIANVERVDTMVRGIRLHPVVTDDDGHRAAASGLLMDHRQPWIRALEAGDSIQAAFDRADEDGAPVSQHTWFVGSLVARQPDRLDQ